MKSIKIIFMLATVLFSFACKKVKLPDSESNKLIGKWTYVSSSGGFSGGQEDASKREIEFTKYGKYRYKDKDPFTFREKYSVEYREPRFVGDKVYVIKYSSGIPHSLSSLSQSFEVIGNTLYLNDEGYDGFSYVYKRK